MTSYKIIMQTGDVSGAGTDGDVKVSLAGQGNSQSQWFTLDKSWYNDFERGDLDGYTVEPNTGLGELTSLYVEMDGNKPGDAWYLDWVIVQELGTDKKWKGTPPNHWFDSELTTGPEVIINSTSQAIHLERDDSLVIPKKRVTTFTLMGPITQEQDV